MHTAVENAFRKHNQPTEKINEFRQNIAAIVGNQIAQLITSAVSIIGSQQKEVQDTYIQGKIQEWQLHPQMERIVLDGANSMKEPPEEYLPAAVSICPDPDQLTCNLPAEKSISDRVRQDIHGLVERQAKSIAGAFVYNSTLEPEESKQFIDKMQNLIPERNQAYQALANVATAVIFMDTSKKQFDNPMEIIRANNDNKHIIESLDITKKPGAKSQTGRQYVIKLIAGIIDEQLETIINDTDPTDRDQLEQNTLFWKEVIDNLPAKM